ncbi:MAG: penicillin-binding protein activator [Pseudomonadota bacterium]
MMGHVLDRRKAWRLAVCALATATLAACQLALPSGPAPRVNGGTVNVGLLLPFGSAQGGDALIARSIENAARLAASEITATSVNISVYPTAGNSAQAASMVDQAIREGADIIVGPLRSDAGAAVGVAAAPRGVSVLSFSNNTEIAGDNVFVLGNTFGNTADRLVRYAAAQNRRRILVLHAQNLAGEVARDAILTAAQRNGSAVVTSVSYEFSANGVVQAIPQVMDAVENQAIDTVFITSDTTGALPLFAQLLPENGLDTEAVRLVGMTRWDTPPQTLELAGLEGGWFALPDPAASAAFSARYQAAYQEPPHVLAGLGYDAIRLIAEASVSTGRLGPADLSAASGFNGANGVFRLNSDGTNSRGLAVASIVESQVSIVDPAPTGSAGPGL